MQVEREGRLWYTTMDRVAFAQRHNVDDSWHRCKEARVAGKRRRSVNSAPLYSSSSDVRLSSYSMQASQKHLNSSSSSSTFIDHATTAPTPDLTKIEASGCQAHTHTLSHSPPPLPPPLPFFAACMSQAHTCVVQDNALVSSGNSLERLELLRHFPLSAFDAA